MKRGNFFHFSVDERLSTISFHFSVDERCSCGSQLMQLGIRTDAAGASNKLLLLFLLNFFNHIHFKQKNKTFILRTVRLYA
jgi:hypothetical protein